MRRCSKKRAERERERERERGEKRADMKESGRVYP
jgi:hypothetical protein